MDILFVSDKEHVLLSSVGEPILDQQVRNHCPVYGVLKFSKPKASSFTRHVWYYGKGNYNLLCEKASEIDWESLRNTDIITFANSINNAITQIALEYGNKSENYTSAVAHVKNKTAYQEA